MCIRDSRSVRPIFKKEVIIHDPDYPRLTGDLEQLTAECRAYVAKKRLEKAPNYFKSVSYTHLLLSGIGELLHGASLRSTNVTELNSTNLIPLPTGEGLGAVSYTHLDVYKRQTFVRYASGIRYRFL